MTEGHDIYAKMAAAAKSVGYGVSKDGRNDFHRYEYTSAANVRKECGSAMGRHGIAVSSSLEIVRSEQRSDAKGKPTNYVEVLATLTFYSAEDGSSLTAQGYGCGTDNGDKAPMKAQTAAEKYAYLSAFTIAMGEDPEADSSTDESARDGAPRVQSDDERWAHEQARRMRTDAERARGDMAENDSDDVRARYMAGLHTWVRQNGERWGQVFAANRPAAIFVWQSISDVCAAVGGNAEEIKTALKAAGKPADEAAQ